MVGFPANNFLAQEPGTNEEIQDFCSSTYNVQFPLFSKISVKGADCHRLYHHLKTERPRADITNGDEFEERLKATVRRVKTRTTFCGILRSFLSGKMEKSRPASLRTLLPKTTRVIAAIDKAVSG